MKNSKPYNYSSKDRVTKNNSTKSFKKQNNGAEKENKKVEKNNELEIEDEESSLDQSFLENRIEKKKNKAIKKKLIAQGNIFLKEIDLLKTFFLGVGGICIVICLIILCFHQFRGVLEKNKVSKIDHLMMKNSDVNIVDYNYVFVGDFYTDHFPFEYFNNDYHYVRVSYSTLSVSDVYMNLKSYVYDYNPSIVFLELGYIDLENGCEINTFIDNYRNLLSSIQENRPYAKIYVESIYPGGLDSNLLVTANNQLKALCEELGVSYIDVYSSFMESGKIDSYVGNHTLSSEGYQALYQLFQKELD